MCGAVGSSSPGLEGELADESAVFGEDADVEVAGEHEDSLAAVTAAEGDVVEPAVVAQGDDALVDAVASDSEVRVDDRCGERPGLWVVLGRPRWECAARGLDVVAARCSSRRRCRADVAGRGVNGLVGRVISQFLRVWWKRSTFPQV